VIEHKPFVFTFADVEVREREFCIVKAGEVLPVEPKAFRVLVFLLRSPHRLITKDELLDAVWNDCAVSENSLTRSIALLRRLLGDDTHEPRYIATVPTVGYRFLCDVEAEEDGFPGVGAADRHHPANGNGLESLNGTPSVQSSSQCPQGQAAVAEKVEEKVEQLSDEGRRRSRRLLVSGLVVATLVILVTGFPALRAVSHRKARTGREVQKAASSRMRIVPLTNLPGWVRYPAFSPDGRQIAFGRCDDHGGGVFTVPALGGSERKLTDVICPHGDAGYPKWIADGKSLLLADSCVPEGPRGLVVFSLGTGEKRCLTAPPVYSEVGDCEPALSPDGKTVAFLRNTTVGPASVYTVALSGGNPRIVTPDNWAARRPMWSSDGQHIIFDSARTGLNRVWRVPATGGASELETVYPATGALSRDGRRLAYVEPSWFWPSRAVMILRIELSSPGGQVVSQNGIIASEGGNQSAQPSPDGRQIVFQSGRTTRPEIWKSDADGSHLLQMTSFDRGFSGTPRWSPDGKWIAFDHHHETHSQIYLIDSEGRNMHAVTSGNYENVVPDWSRDGTAVYFASNRTGSMQVWRRDLVTGRETQMTHHGGFAASESYDGKRLYYSRFEGGGIWSMPVGGGEEQQVTDALHKGYWGHFAVTDAGLYLLNSESAPKPMLMFYKFQTRRLTPVLQLENSFPGMPNLAASRDGRIIWFAQGAWQRSLTMAENFQ